VLSGFDAVAPAPAGIDLEHPSRWAPNSARRVIESRGALDDAHDQTVLVYEQQVEGDAGVVHPELVIVAKSQVEKHSPILGHAPAKHQTARRVVLRTDEICIDDYAGDIWKAQVSLRQPGLQGLRVGRAARRRA